MGEQSAAAMKTIGVLGGMSWESSIVYYTLLNEQVKARLGGLHSADLLLRSVDFAPVAELQRQGAWDRAGEMLAGEARALRSAGAQVLLLATNTMHTVADAVAGATDMAFVHIADATAAPITARGIGRVGLLATAYTMEQDFYVGHMRDHHGLDVVVPGPEDRALVHRVIYEELVLGRVEPASRDAYRQIMAGLVADGCEAIILGCTEIDLLVGPDDVDVPVFDSTALHVQAAVDAAL